MNFRHLVETQLLQSSKGKNCTQESGVYDDFANEVLRLYNDSTDHKELIAQLIYADIELIEALHHHPDNRYLIKASRLVQKILRNIELEFKHQTLTITEKKRKKRSTTKYKWSTDDVHFVELVYRLIESKSMRMQFDEN